MNACLLTVSDRASKGVYDDLSGPAMRQFLENKVRGLLLSRGGFSSPRPARAGGYKIICIPGAPSHSGLIPSHSG